MRRRMFFAAVFLLTGLAINAQKINRVKITDLEKVMAESRNPVIINFWATWCKPCIEEIPYFQKLVSGYRADSVELLLVSLDVEEEFPKGIQKVAARRGFTAPIVWLDETNADYFCPRVDPKWSGAIPATLFLNNKTGYRKFHEEQLSEETLEVEIKALLGK